MFLRSTAFSLRDETMSTLPCAKLCDDGSQNYPDLFSSTRKHVVIFIARKRRRVKAP